MFKKLLFILPFLQAVPALAQTCPTRPPGDNTNACASTAFVQQSVTPVPFSVPNGGTGNTTFTAGLPLIGNGVGALGQGTRSGSTTIFGTTYGVLTNGHCVSIDSSGNLIDAGSACAVGGGSGTVSSSTLGNFGYYAATGNTISGVTPAQALAALPTGVYWLGRTAAKCDNSTDDTAVIQAAWNAAAALNQDLYIGGVGLGICMISTITQPAPVAEFGNRSGLIGAGTGATKLISSVGNGSCAIVFSSATYTTAGRLGFPVKDFTISGTGAYTGNGICLTNIISARFDNIVITYFQNGVYATDSINISWYDCKWIGMTGTGVDALFGSNTHPNAWSFYNPHIFFVTNYGLIFDHPTQLNIYGGDFENNNIGGIAGASVIYVNGNPTDGTAGLNVNGGYYSVNAGTADITIYDGASTLAGVHNISGAEMDRASPTQYVTHNIFVINSGTGVTTLNVNGSGFQGFNSYPVSAARGYVVANSVASSNYVINFVGNFFGSVTEKPTTGSGYYVHW